MWGDKNNRSHRVRGQGEFIQRRILGGEGASDVARARSELGVLGRQGEHVRFFRRNGRRFRRRLDGRNMRAVRQPQPEKV